MRTALVRSIAVMIMLAPGPAAAQGAGLVAEAVVGVEHADDVGTLADVPIGVGGIADPEVDVRVGLPRGRDRGRFDVESDHASPAAGPFSARAVRSRNDKLGSSDKSSSGFCCGSPSGPAPFVNATAPPPA